MIAPRVRALRGDTWGCGGYAPADACTGRYSPVRRYPRIAETARSTSVCEL